MHYAFLLGDGIGLALRVALICIIRIQNPSLSYGILHLEFMQHFVERNRRHAIVLCNLRYGDGIFAV